MPTRALTRARPPASRRFSGRMALLCLRHKHMLPMADVTTLATTADSADSADSGSALDEETPKL
jgi:hypothetical protein